MRSLIILPISLLLIYGFVWADIIYTKDGQELRGVIVEDYHDRVVLSTLTGELPLSKQDIEKIAYDSTEDNYLKLADSYKDKGDYKAALYYYEAAYKINPDMRQAQEGALLTTNLLLRKKESELEQQIRLKQDAEENRGVQGAETPPKDPLLLRRQGLLDKAGISLKLEGADIVVEKVIKNSAADTAGIMANDRIIAVWGKLVKYMQLKDAYDLLLASDVREVRLTIARTASVNLQRKGMFNSAEKMIGARLEIEFEGLTCAGLTSGGPLEKAGVIAGDRIVKIEDAPTKYMPLETVCQLIEKIKSNVLNIETQREVVFWKRG